MGEDLEEGDEPTTKSDGANKSSSGSKAKVSSSKENPSPALERPPVLDARARFGANLFLLSGVELGWVFTELELHCPKALDPWGEAKVEINVDEIPSETFSRLNKYVSDLLSTDGTNPTFDSEIPKKKKRKSS